MSAECNQRFDGPFDVSFYMPCLNEEENVGPALEELAAVATRRGLRAEVLVFDDGSTDRTSAVVERLAPRLEAVHDTLRIELIRLPSSRGLGANFFAGAARARGTRYMLVNGDHSERVETLDDVLARLGEADLVITIFDTGDVRGLARRGLSRLFTWLVNRLNGHRLRYYNGPTLHLRVDVVRFATSCRGFAYQAELLTRALDAGRSYVEVPMINRDRESGVSKAFAPRNLVSVARSLWRIGTRSFGPPPVVDG
ncbi:MAG: glycosyltransferase family 2 protein [Acidobacteriota bacterium]